MVVAEVSLATLEQVEFCAMKNFKGSSLNLGIGSVLGADRAMKLRQCLCLTRNDVDRLKLNVTLVLLSSRLFDPIEINHPLFNLVKIAK